MADDGDKKPEEGSQKGPDKSDRPKAEASQSEGASAEGTSEKPVEPKANAPKPEAPKAEPPKAEPPKEETPKAEAPEPEDFKPEPPIAEPQPAPPSSIRAEMAGKSDTPKRTKPSVPKTDKVEPETPKAAKPKPEVEKPKAEEPKKEPPKAETPKPEVPKKDEAPKAAAGAAAGAAAAAVTSGAIERPTDVAPASPAPRRKRTRKAETKRSGKRQSPRERRRERREAKRERKRNRGVVAKLFFGLVKTVAVLVVIAGLGVAGWVALYVNRLSQDLPDYSVLTEYEPPIMTRIHAGDGTLIAEYANERRLFVPIEQMPETVVHAFVAAEDQHFYEHPGIDIRGIARASIANVFNYLNDRRLEGASTITQQVAKNFLLSSEVRLERKIREQLLALRIERTFTKDQILELYLNQIYLGWRSYGVAAAALNYFDKSLDELTIAEAAYLAVMPKAPNNYRPDRESTRERSLERRNYVLNRMAEDGYITRAEAEEAMLEPLVINERPAGAQSVEAEYFAEEVRREVAGDFGYDALLDGGLSVRTTIDMDYQRFARDALRHGLTAYDQRHGWRGPVAHLDTMDDWEAQVAALELPRDLAPWRPAVVERVNDGAGTVEINLADDNPGPGVIPLSEMSWAREQASNGIDIGAPIERPSQVLHVGDVIWVEPVVIEAETTEAEGGEEAPAPVTYDEPTFGLRQVPAVNGGIMAMDPHTGRILAMVGGFSFDASEFNRSVQAWRQPGSSFKPYVYAAALEAGHTPSDLILDAPFVMPQGDGLPLWRPDNYSDRFYGPSTLRSGVERSRNAMTVRLAQDVGMEHVVDIAVRFGVVDRLDPYLAYALGAGETTLERQVTGFSQFVNGGRRLHPYIVERVQDRYGHTLERADTRECTNCNMDEWDGRPAPVLTDNREQILDPRTAYQIVSILEGVVQRGTGRSLRSLGVPLGGKTGTTNDERDAWFMGVSPDLVVGAYVGFDSPRPMGRAETGGRVAAPVVREFFEHTVATRPPIPFRRPPGIRIVRVNAETGQLAQPGDLNVIEEAFRPGTEPTGERTVIGADGFNTQTSDDDELRSGSGGLY